jgi:hypothetical protein
MKRTIIVLTIIALVIIGVSFSYQNAMASKAVTCCQVFRVVDNAGNVVPSCTIVVEPCTSTQGCHCTTGATGQCTICGLTAGNSYTATASCPTEGSVSVTFTACVTSVVIINVH